MSKSKYKRRTKLNPNRFKQEPELADLGLFAFDPIRLKVFQWGLIAGLLGSLFTAQAEFWARMFGMLIIVLLANYQINQASKVIPRWHAATLAILGIVSAVPVATVINALVVMVIVYYEGTL
ncbi:hypothetical protein QUF58_05295 [Anaerolineales bacterium HSG24]|nr:hypothetical protein [Anaerolineales bacterium HSG24]